MVIKSDSTLPGFSYVEWSSIIAGTVLALAISIILVQFSGLVGLNVFDPTQPGEKTRWMVIIVSVWLFWVQLMASMSGGYAAGRLRNTAVGFSEHENEVRDGAHGLITWALSTLIAVAGAALVSAIAAHTATPTEATQHHAEIAEHITKNAGIIFGFSAAAGSFVSAAAATWIATIAGQHRDKSTRFVAFRRLNRA